MKQDVVPQNGLNGTILKFDLWFIQEITRKEDLMAHTKSYISPNVIITEHLPENINAYIQELTFLDQTDPDLFLNRVDDLWVLAKNAYAEGQISKQTFDQLDEKYIAYSNQIFIEELQNEHKNL
jgi:hypothetical protein